MHPKVIASALGIVIAAGGGVMLIPTVYSLFVADGTTATLAFPALGAGLGGLILFFSTRARDTHVAIQDVFLIVVLGWCAVAAVGSLPYLLSGLMSPVNAFFEAMAGFTTTGASTIITPEEVAPSLLLWRSLCQWTGGIGIVLLFVAIGPLIGFGASQLYSAEVANPVAERLTPRIRDTAKTLAYIYLALTAAGIIALFAAGMGIFDAVNHALTAVSTGGYSTRSGSIAAFDSWPIELAVTVTMLFSGVNYALYFQAARGRLGMVSGNPELRVYLGIVAVGTTIMTVSLYAFDYQKSLVTSFREALFQSVSLLTGTAFSTADWNSWDPLSHGLLLTMMAIGGCAGSTCGGIKVVRAILLAANVRQQVFHMIHPQAITPLRLRDKVMPESLRASVLGFFFVYVATLLAGTLLVALHGVPIGDPLGATFACLNITGTFLGPVGEAQFYAGLPATAKLTLTVFMLLGRLELFTVLVVLTPSFWRS